MTCDHMGNETVGIEVGDSGSRGKDGTGIGAYRPKQDHIGSLLAAATRNKIN